MDSSNISPSQIQQSHLDFPSQHPQGKTLSPQILSQTPISLSSDHNTYKLIKQHPKFLRKIISSNTVDQHHRIFPMERKANIERLKNHTKLLRNAKTTTHLSQSLHSSSPFDLSYSLSRFKYLQNITTLDLNLSLTSPNIQILSQIIPNLKNLKTFSFEAPVDFALSSQLIDAVFFAFKRLKSLSHLSFKFDSPLEFGDLQIEQLALHLSQSPQLQGLKLCFRKAHKVTNAGLQSLAQAFKNLPSLLEISLGLWSVGGCSISTFKQLFSGLAACKALKRLDIDLTPDFYCDPYRTEPLSSCLKMLNTSSLRELSLVLYQNFTDFGLTELSKTLTRFSSLKTLKMDFSNDPSISDIGLARLSSAFETLTSLSTLSLSSLGSCTGLQAPIEFISQGITPLTQLKSLSLDFKFCGGKKSSTIRALSTSLKGLKSLTELNLNLFSVNFLDDEEFALLTERLENLKDLTSLVIDLRDNQKLTNQSVKSLVSSFSCFSKLAHLTLKLQSKRINGEALSIFANGLLQSLPALHSLDFVCSNISESNYKQGFEVLCKALKNVISLRKISLEANKRFFVSSKKVQELERVKSVIINWVWSPAQVEKREVLVQKRSFHLK